MLRKFPGRGWGQFGVAAAGAAAVLAGLAVWNGDSARQPPVEPAALASPVAIGWDGTALWMVTGRGDDGDAGRALLLRFDPASGAIEAAFPLDVDPVAAAFDLTARRAFIVALGLQQGVPDEGVRGQIVAVDLEGQTLGTGETGAGPVAVALEVATGRPLVLSRGTGAGPGALRLYEAETLAPLAEVALGTYPVSVDLTADSKLALVANYVGHSVSVVELGGEMLSREVSFGAQPGRTARARPGPSGSVAVVTNLSERSREPDPDPGRVEVLDLRSGRIQWSAEFVNPIDAWMTESGEVVVVEEAGGAYTASVLDEASGQVRYAINGTGSEVSADLTGRLVFWRPAEDRVVILDIATGAELCQSAVSPRAVVHLVPTGTGPIVVATSSGGAVAWPIGATCERDHLARSDATGRPGDAGAPEPIAFIGSGAPLLVSGRGLTHGASDDVTVSLTFPGPPRPGIEVVSITCEATTVRLDRQPFPGAIKYTPDRADHGSDGFSVLGSVPASAWDLSLTDAVATSSVGACYRLIVETASAEQLASEVTCYVAPPYSFGPIPTVGSGARATAGGGWWGLAALLVAAVVATAAFAGVRRRG